MCGWCKRRCCRPKSPPKEKTDTVLHVKTAIDKKEIPYGFINIFPGENDLSITVDVF